MSDEKDLDIVDSFEHVYERIGGLRPGRSMQLANIAAQLTIATELMRIADKLDDLTDPQYIVDLACNLQSVAEAKELGDPQAPDET